MTDELNAVAATNNGVGDGGVPLPVAENVDPQTVDAPNMNADKGNSANVNTDPRNSAIGTSASAAHAQGDGNQADPGRSASDGVAGVSALRGLIVYGGVFAFAALYTYFAVVITRASTKVPTLDSTLVDSAAALAGILGSAFALRIGNTANQSFINQSLAGHLDDARAGGANRRTKAKAYLHRAVSLEVGEQGAASWPITFGIWAYGLVGSMIVVVYVLNEQQTPGTVKALAVVFAGYVLALLTSVFKSTGDSGSGA